MKVRAFLLLSILVFLCASCIKTRKSRCEELRDNIVGAWDVVSLYLEIRGDTIYYQSVSDLPGTKDVIFYEDGTGINYMIPLQGGVSFDWEFRCEDEFVDVYYNLPSPVGGGYPDKDKSFDVKKNEPYEQMWESVQIDQDSGFVYITTWKMDR